MSQNSSHTDKYRYRESHSKLLLECNYLIQNTYFQMITVLVPVLVNDNRVLIGYFS